MKVVIKTKSIELIFKYLNKEELAEIRNIIDAELRKLNVADVYLDELDLERRAYNALSKYNINTLHQLLNTSKSDLLKMRNFGVMSLRDIENVLDNLNLKLKA